MLVVRMQRYVTLLEHLGSKQRLLELSLLRRLLLLLQKLVEVRTIQSKALYEQVVLLRVLIPTILIGSIGLAIPVVAPLLTKELVLVQEMGIQ